MVTMKDVARTAGVSIYTVSATLSGASPVSAELRARVEAAVRKLGYERNSMARGLRRGTSSLIGLIISDATNPFFMELVDCIQTEAQAQGFSLLLGISGHDVARERELLRLMRSHQAAGTILCPAGSRDDYSDGDLAAGRMQVVAIDNASSELPVDTVALDNRGAAKLATGHLLQLGHRRVAMVAGMPHQFVGQERLAGYRDALAAHGVAFDETLIDHGNFRLEDAYRACHRLLSEKPAPTALFVANNLMLIGVMRALGDRGIAVPDSVSVCSIDDFPWAPAFQPSLTVVRQPVADMASAAFQHLVARLQGTGGAPQHQLFAPQLLVRKSCARRKDERKDELVQLCGIDGVTS
jgi:LacI family transcriptional regulator